MTKYKVTGQDRAEGALGAAEPFCIYVEATARGVVVKEAIDARYASGREHVLVSSVEVDQ
jgi:hypothetical protein